MVVPLGGLLHVDSYLSRTRVEALCLLGFALDDATEARCGCMLQRSVCQCHKGTIIAEIGSQTQSSRSPLHVGAGLDSLYLLKKEDETGINALPVNLCHTRLLSLPSDNLALL